MLTPPLHERLGQAGRQFQQERGTGVLLRLVPWLFGVALLLAIADVVCHLQAGTRLWLDAFFLVLTACAAALWWIFARIQRSTPEQTARLLESRNPALGSKLINWLQLRRQVESPDTPEVTAQLARLAVTEYETGLAHFDFIPLTKSPQRPREKKTAILAAATFLAVLLAAWPVSTAVLPRFFDPFGDHPPYSFTRIEILAPSGDGTTVDYDGALIIKARTSGHRPSDLFLSFYDPAHPETVHTVPMFDKGEAGFSQALEKVRSDLVVIAHTKNRHSLSKQRRIQVELIPRFTKAWVKISPPAYTGIPPRETPFDFKNLSVLTGTEVQFRIQSNRPLASGSIHFPTTPGAPPVQVALSPSAAREVTGRFTATTATRLGFSLTDSAGHASAETPSAALAVTSDLPPAVSIDTPTQDGFVAEDFRVECRISASDDYGLKTLRLHRALNDQYSAPKEISFPTITTSTAETIVFGLPTLGVQPGDVLSLFAEVIDTAPTPQLARTRVLRLNVISTADYNQFLRERADISDIQGKYTQLVQQMQDLVARQKEIAEQAAKLRDTAASATDPAAQKEAAKALDQLLAQQAELNQKLNKMAERMEKFVRDQPLYDIENELRDTLRQRAAEIRASTRENDAALRQQLAQAGATPPAPATPPGDTAAALQQSAQKQLENLGATQQKTADAVMPPLQDAALMQAMVNDLNAIKYLHQVQTTAAAQAKAYEHSDQLSEEDRLALSQLAATERQVGEAMRKVMENLRQHADAAEKVFPGPAASARDLADQIDMRRIAPIAGQTASSMQSGDGPEAAQLAERLRSEIDGLFAEAQEQTGPMGQSFGQCLKLRKMSSGATTFQQMLQSRKFGFGSGQGAMGQGQNGQGGLDGFAASTGSNAAIMGNETLGGTPSDASANGRGADGRPLDARALELERSKGHANTPEVNRPSEDVQSGSALDEYREVIDAYFNSITQ